MVGKTLNCHIIGVLSPYLLPYEIVFPNRYLLGAITMQERSKIAQVLKRIEVIRIHVDIHIGSAP